MASVSTLAPSRRFRERLARHGGATVSRCYQCATCSAVCELAPDDAPFPRRQMLLAQWGLEEEAAADPSVWLCHQCNDCTVRCPRDARPGDVLQSLRAMMIETLAFPRALGAFVGSAGSTWPLLLVLPILFWTGLLALTGHLAVPAHFDAFEDAVPHALIYAVFFPAVGWTILASWIGGRRFWKRIGASGARSGAFAAHLFRALGDVATHKRFGICSAARPRRWGHFALMWGFAGAAFTSALLIVGIYIQRLPMPLPLDHPYKLIGNFSAVLLVVGGVWLVANRTSLGNHAGASTAFDNYFLSVVVLVIATGVLAETARLVHAPRAAITIYVVHLGMVLNLFLTLPYSKFAHILYRTLAMTHESMATPHRPTG